MKETKNDSIETEHRQWLSEKIIMYGFDRFVFNNRSEFMRLDRGTRPTAVLKAQIKRSDMNASQELHT